MSASVYLDIVISLPLVWGIYRGFSKGFIIELASLVALGLGIYGGIKFSGLASGLLVEKFEINSRYLPVISFALTFLVIVVAVFLLAKVIESIVNVASLKLVNKIAGAAFGFLKTAIIVFILLFFVESADKKVKWIPEEIKKESFFYRTFRKIPFQQFDFPVVVPEVIAPSTGG